MKLLSIIRSITLSIATTALCIALPSCEGRANIADDGQTGHYHQEAKVPQLDIRLKSGTTYPRSITVTFYVDNYYSDQIHNYSDIECGVYYRPVSAPEYYTEELTEDLSDYATTFYITKLQSYTQYIITPFVRYEDYPDQEYVGNPIQASTY